MKKAALTLPLIALLAACGSGGSSSGSSQIKIVGSSTVYPFTTAVSESFQKAHPGTSITVESTGTGAGMKLFCAGIGENFPDMVDASRPMKASEYAICAKNGAKKIIQIPIGIDGLTIIEAKNGPLGNLTQRDIYAALAANPFGKGPNRAQTWKDVNPTLPAVKIRVLGPPPTSGTRDSLADLYLAKGCDTDSTMAALGVSDENKHKDLCTRIREDGAYVEAGENDNLLVQKVSGDPGTLGVLGYSYLEQNADKIRPVDIAGIAPTEATIANLTYPGARKLFVYLKGEHLQAKPLMKQLMASYVPMWGKGGPLEKRGLVPLSVADAKISADQVVKMTPLDPTTLK